MHRSIDISSNTILRIIAIIVGCWLLYVIRDVIWLFLIAIIITAALNPVIKGAQKFFKSPRTSAVFFVYVTFFVILGILISIIVPALTEQFEQFIHDLPSLFVNMTPSFFSVPNDLSLSDMGQRFIGTITNPFSTTIGFLTGVVSTAAVISMSFYMSLQEDGLKDSLLIITPEQHKKYISSLIDRIQENFGRWMAGQLVTMIFVGFLYYIALTILGVPYAPVLALMGGLLEIVPYFGPVLAAIPAMIFGSFMDPVVGLLVGLAYLAINMIENYFLIPKIMNKAVGLNPVLVILALLIGAKIAGVIGILLAVPLAGAIGLFLKDVVERKVL
jgi:predicted PurR-regulated permease PerM